MPSATSALLVAQLTPLEGVLERLQLPPRSIPRAELVTEAAAVDADCAPAVDDAPVVAECAPAVAPDNGHAPPVDSDLPPLDDAPLMGSNNAQTAPDSDLPPLDDGGLISDDDDDHGHAGMDLDDDDDASMHARASSIARTSGLGHDLDSPTPLSGIRPRKSLGLSRFAAAQQGLGVEHALESITVAGLQQRDREEEREAENREAKDAVVKRKGGRKRRELSPGSTCGRAVVHVVCACA